MSASIHTAAVIGAGPAGLMAAEVLARAGCAVTVFDRMPSVARKFLMAGRGGLNLTHSEPLERFLTRYGAAMPGLLQGAITAFPPAAVVDWCHGLEQPTFVGSSGRVFPRAMKASPLLRAWLARLDMLDVAMRTATAWQGWAADGALRFSALDGSETVEHYDVTVLAVGGASWPRLGSDGAWVPLLAEAGIGVAPLVPANAGLAIAWSDVTRARHAGAPLKRIGLSVGDARVRGEALVTRDGLEGGAVYALSEAIRAALSSGGPVRLTVDLRPDLDTDAIAARLAKASRKDSLSNRLRKAVGLSPAAISVLRDGIAAAGRSVPEEPGALANAVKEVPLETTGFSGLARAISTAGGVVFSDLDAHWMLIRRPGTFVAGEMLDWSAPTGGYLLTACLASGRAAGEGAAAWLARTMAEPQVSGARSTS